FFDVPRGHGRLLTADSGKGVVVLPELGKKLGRGLEEHSGPLLLERQPGAIALGAGFDSELHEKPVPHADAAQDLLEDAVLAVLRVDLLLKRAQVTRLPPAMMVLLALEAPDLIAQAAGPHQPQGPLG